MLENPIGIAYEIADLRAGKAPDDLSLVNIVNPMLPGYLESDYGSDIAYLESLEGRQLVVDGPYIDLSPGTPEPAIREITRRKVLEAIEYSARVGADEIIFLSTFLPFIGLKSYSAQWLEKSTAFWREIMSGEGSGERSGEGGPAVSVCNTFEFDPALLLELKERIDHPRFRLAIDIGHILVWSKAGIGEWCDRAASHARTICLHSNDGGLDLHQSIREGVLTADAGFPALLDCLRANPELRVLLKYSDSASAPADREYLCGL